MNITIYPRKLEGTLTAIPSKSQAHRLLICAAFSDHETTLVCSQTNEDIEATVSCLCSLGAEITRTKDGYQVIPISVIPKSAHLNFKESGSTLRFLLPVIGALGVDATITMEGRLPKRPLSPLWEEMERMGCVLSRPSENSIRCVGKLRSGKYTICGNISSQYITGLLFAMALMEGTSTLDITGNLESKPYVDMTRDAMSLFGIDTSGYQVTGCAPFHSPGQLIVEGDWSNAAFFLTAKALGNTITIDNLNPNSHQGDRAIVAILKQLKDGSCTIDASDIPDLVPILSVAAAAMDGCTFTGIERLRLKESDRVASVLGVLKSLGITAEATQSTLTVSPGRLTGGIVDTVNDHRIAMSAAIAATIAREPVTILGAECVKKSYPAFWAEYQHLGGNYEQHLW